MGTPPLGTQQGGDARHPHLKHHDFAIVRLQVEGPGGGDEALGRADNVIAEGGDQIEHGERRLLQLQALQRSRDIVSPLSPCHPIQGTTSHPEDVAGLSWMLRAGDVQDRGPAPGGSPSLGLCPQGCHPAPGLSPTPRQPRARTSSLNNRSRAAPRCRGRFLSWQPLRALDSWPSRRFVIFKASLLESAWLLPATGFEHFPTAPCTVRAANRK